MSRCAIRRRCVTPRFCPACGLSLSVCARSLTHSCRLARIRARKTEQNMKTWMKWTLGVVGGAAVVAVVAGAIGWQLADSKMARQIAVASHPVAYAEDTQTLDRGRYLFESRGCAECHGTNGGGH